MFIQAAENVAESMVNLASSEAIVMVTVDNADEEVTTLSSSTQAISFMGATGGIDCGQAGPSGLTSVTSVTGSAAAPISSLAGSEPMVVVHRGKEELSDHNGLENLASDLALGLDVSALTESLRGAEGGVKVSKVCGSIICYPAISL